MKPWQRVEAALGDCPVNNDPDWRGVVFFAILALTGVVVFGGWKCSEYHKQEIEARVQCVTQAKIPLECNYVNF